MDGGRPGGLHSMGLKLVVTEQLTHTHSLGTVCVDCMLKVFKNRRTGRWICMSFNLLSGDVCQREGTRRRLSEGQSGMEALEPRPCLRPCAEVWCAVRTSLLHMHCYLHFMHYLKGLV